MQKYSDYANRQQQGCRGWCLVTTAEGRAVKVVHVRVEAAGMGQGRVEPHLTVPHESLLAKLQAAGHHLQSAAPSESWIRIYDLGSFCESCPTVAPLESSVIFMGEWHDKRASETARSSKFHGVDLIAIALLMRRSKNLIALSSIYGPQE